MLAAHGISKSFGRTAALTAVDFCARAGEIHALIGENGAGKSTLINIFAGRLRPSRGTVTLDGATIRRGSSAALACGIAAVYQSPLLFERMCWEENLALGGFCGDGRYSLARTTERAIDLAGQLGFTLPLPGATVERGSMAERVRLEILRALSFVPRVLILDEPTALLGPGELAPFLALIRRLRAAGRIVLIVTHKLTEALAVADRITVLRRGRVVAERITAESNQAELARLMIGDVVAAPTARAAAVGPPLAALEHVTLEADGRRVLDNISLTLCSGAISGIAGVDGNGQDELIEVIAGARAPTRGVVRLPAGVQDADALTVIPHNRDLQGLILDLSLWENLLLSPALRRRLCGRGGWIRRARAAAFCQNLMHRFAVRAAGPHAHAGSLSGGNRQRFVVARALAAAPRAIVARDICRGLDLGAIAELHDRLRGFAAEGGAVLLISSDLDELLALCGKLYVICRGRLTAAPSRDPTALGLLMSGVSP